MESDETQCILPPISNLLQYPVDEDVNIEEGLCKPQNENLFLLSSIAFLQKQLIKKLDNQTVPKHDDQVDKRYSDLLLVESGQKSKRQKCFIKLSNMEKFDEVLKSEACLPQKLLSNTQLLPVPKKNKSSKLSLTNIFKQKSNADIRNPIPKKSNSLFNIFRKSSTFTKVSESNLSFSANSVMQIDPGKYVDIDDNEYVHQSVCSLTSITSLREDVNQATLNTSATDMYFDENRKYQTNLIRNKDLSDIEEEILKVIPTETNLEIKKSINEKLRVSKRSSECSLKSQRTADDVKFVKREDDFLEDPQTGIKFKCIPKGQTHGRRIREQQSKLSVCIEDEPDSDIDMYSQQRNYPFKSEDCVKPIVSAETIDVIMNELLYQLEERLQ